MNSCLLNKKDNKKTEVDCSIWDVRGVINPVPTERLYVCVCVCEMLIKWHVLSNKTTNNCDLPQKTVRKMFRQL